MLRGRGNASAVDSKREGCRHCPGIHALTAPPRTKRGQASHTPDSVQSVICLSSCRQRLPGGVLLRTSIAAATGTRCVFTREPVPPALLPVGHSPSRRSRLQRWWAFTPPFHPSPQPKLGPVCFLLQLSSRADCSTRALTCCFVRQPCPIHIGLGVGKFLSSVY